MTIELVQKILAWTAVVNILFLLVWIGFITFAHDWVYRLHSKWVPLSVEKFNAIHYAGLAFYKLSIIMLNIAPYLAIRLIT